MRFETRRTVQVVSAQVYGWDGGWRSFRGGCLLCWDDEMQTSQMQTSQMRNVASTPHCVGDALSCAGSARRWNRAALVLFEHFPLWSCIAMGYR